MPRWTLKMWTHGALVTTIRCIIAAIVVAGVLITTSCFGRKPDPKPKKDVFDILLGVSPESLTIPAGGMTSATVNLAVNSGNTCFFAQLSAVAAGGASLPTWLHVTLSPKQFELSESSEHASMTVVVDPSAPQGISDVFVTATCEDFSAPSLQFDDRLTVASEGEPPSITSISPSAIIAGGGAFTLTVNGSNFVAASAVNWNGNQLSTTFVSATQLTAQVPGADVANPGTATITVVGPGTSNAVTLTVFAQSSLGIITDISESGTGALSNATPNPIIALSANGRYAAFENEGATNLVSDPTISQTSDIYFHDSCVGAADCTRLTQLASVINGFSGNGGNDGNGGSIGSQRPNSVSISGDGRFVTFLSHATNLNVPGAEHDEVYVRDTCTAVATGCEPSTRMISLTDSGAEPNDASVESSMSADGGFVAFVSLGTNLVSSAVAVPPAQAYLRSTLAGCQPGSCTLLVSLDGDGNPFASGAGQIAVSQSGRFVVFDAFPNSGPILEHVFVRDTCVHAPAGSGCHPSTTEVSLDNNGNPAPTGAVAASISDDGRFIAFTSADQLAANSLPSPNINLYLRDTCQTETGPVAGCTASTVTASLASDGSEANAGLPQQEQFGNPHKLSGDGRFVVFASQATNLVPGGTPAGGVFVRDTCAHGPAGCTPNTVLVSENQDGRFVLGEFPVISSDGHYCAFMVGLSEVEPQEQAALALTSF